MHHEPDGMTSGSDGQLAHDDPSAAPLVEAPA
jgi:hypothetical protein